MANLMVPVSGAAFMKPALAGYGYRAYGSSSGYAGMKSPAVGPSVDWTLPSADAAGFLKSNGSATLSFATVTAADIGSGAAPTKTDDTNVTLTLGGSPTTALLAASSITAGWTGTLAAARLNSNVVQSVVNDTNVTGSIAAQALTLSWTGTLASGRLNSNVVQGITNDTNVTGSISAQNLTLGWTSTLAVSRGGIGVGTLAVNGVLYGNTTSAVQALAVNSTATNKFLTQSSSNAPAWATIAASDLPGSFNGFANPSGSQVDLTGANGSAATALRSDCKLILDQSIAPTWTALHIFATAARSSGVASYHAVRTPADTGLTASTESIGIQFGGNSSAATVTRQWATGALTTQRETLFVGPTYAFVGASTLTTAATVAIDGPPIAGTNATISTPLALWVQSGQARFSGDGAASIAGVRLTGTVFTGGSATTTKPLLFIEPTTSAPTSNNWSTNGTGIGLNLASGFTGNLMRLMVNAVTKFTVDTGGAMINDTSQSSASEAFTARNTTTTNCRVAGFFGGEAQGTFNNGLYIGFTGSTGTFRGLATNTFYIFDDGVTARSLCVGSPNGGTGGSTITFNPDATANLRDAMNFVCGSTTGNKFGTATSEKLAFHGSTAVVQRAGAAQAAVVTTASTQTTPWGYSTQAQADAIVTLVNELRAAVVEKGLIKGAA